MMIIIRMIMLNRYPTRGKCEFSLEIVKPEKKQQIYCRQNPQQIKWLVWAIPMDWVQGTKNKRGSLWTGRGQTNGEGMGRKLFGGDTGKTATCWCRHNPNFEVLGGILQLKVARGRRKFKNLCICLRDCIKPGKKGTVWKCALNERGLDFHWPRRRINTGSFFGKIDMGQKSILWLKRAHR